MAARLVFPPFKPEYGYFYSLMPQLTEDVHRIDVRNDWIVAAPSNSVDRLARVGFGESVGWEVRRRVCTRNVRHGVKRWGAYRDVEIFPGELSPIIRSIETYPLLFRADVAIQLLQSGLTGFSMSAIDFHWHDPTVMPQRPKVLLCTTHGTIEPIRARIEPPEADRCPFCGHAPLVCPECGYCLNGCPKCGKDWGVPPDDHKGLSDNRITLNAFQERNVPFDIRTWDGSDFVGDENGACITRRALDFLLSIHAWPFIAFPVAVDTLNLTDKERARLEHARRPLSTS